MDEEQKRELSALKVKRGVCKGRLTKLKQYFEGLDEEKCTEREWGVLAVKFEKFETGWGEFCEYQTQIEVLVVSNNDVFEQESSERDSFEEEYCALTADVKRLLNKYYWKNTGSNSLAKSSGHSVANSSVANSAQQNVSSIAKLPPINLPVFDGQYEKWLDFKESFSALVDQNMSLNNVQKFLYLKLSLKENVLQVIQSIEVSVDSYTTAWQLLVDRYENTKMIVFNHIKAIFEYPSLCKESHLELRKLFDNVKRHLRSLTNLKIDTTSWDPLIIYILSNKFDNHTRRDWESYKCIGILPTLDELNSFLHTKCEVLEKLEACKIEKNKFNVQSQGYQKKTHSFASTEGQTLKCLWCKQETHNILNDCKSFQSLDINEKINAVKSLKVCFNCLKPYHNAWKCRAPKCSKCFKSHSVLLHYNKEEKFGDTGQSRKSNMSINGGDNTTGSQGSEGKSIVASACMKISNGGDDAERNGDVATYASHSQVLLSTAEIQIKVGNKIVSCRALLDSGSQSNFMSEALCKKLEITPYEVSKKINGIGLILSKINKQVDVLIKSHTTDFSMDIKCLVLPRITDRLPLISFNKTILNLPINIVLADPNFNIKNEIDMLLGSEVFWSILGSQRKELGKNMPILQDSALGWIIAGNLSLNNSTTEPNKMSVNNLCMDVCTLDQKLSKFWDIEEVDIERRNLSLSEKYCEDYFKETTTRDEQGKFVVRIPFKNNLNQLGFSRNIALNRFESLEKRLKKNSSLKKEYQTFMAEYENLGHMKKIVETEIVTKDNFYLPHHAVVREESCTTKCRVVFNASEKSSSGLSLNDIQFNGPTLQQDVFSILSRFRKHKYVMTADVSKMYRCIMLTEDERKYQRVFWRAEPNEKLECYELQTVTYGTTSAPYLAVRCLIQLAMDYKDIFPEACAIIRKDFYMDDLLTGCDRLDDVMRMQGEISQILSSAGFQLRKWLCNKSDILNQFKVNKNLDVSVLSIGENQHNKTLGIFWNASKDLIEYKIKDFSLPQRLTKRHILSIICQIFDPLGLLGPIIVIAKLIIQDLWKLKIDWDEENLPSDLKIKWTTFLNELTLVNEFKIPRHVLCSEYVTIELHGFCDSSEKAYGAVLYVRCVLKSGLILSNVLAAKSRVAPIKCQTLAKLELCSAALLANLAHKTKRVLEISFHNTFYWTDSMISLAWIQGDLSRWKQFVANRVSEIQNLTDVNNWYHVKSKQNPADLLSRGVTPKELYGNEFWFHGPKFLCLEKSEWNHSKIKVDFEIPEQKSTKSNVNVQILNFGETIDFFEDILNKFSSYSKILKVLSYVLRFVYNLKLKRSNSELKIGVLTPSEIESANKLLIRHVQELCFKKDYETLKNNGTLHKKSKILSLNPFMREGLIMVGGRLVNANLPFERKHPIILPKNHVLTDLLLRQEHVKLMHCGAQQLLCSIREQYWPISGRNSCKKIVRQCITCFKAKPPKFENYLMGELPSVRVNPDRPFINVGTDYGGPFYIKDRKTRGAKILKSYVCLFVCLCTKAVHIELVSELTTECFFASLNRFVSRRGKPSHIFSDNASNYIGANNELNQVYKFLKQESKNIAESVNIDKIKWHFIPARSPNFGGVWEAGIKSIKHHLKRVVNKESFTFEEFNTILVQVEGILNSRPLCPLYPDPTDLTALTPGHFLIGQSLTAIPEVNLTDVCNNRLKKWQRLQAIVQHVWKRWKNEYLPELQRRVKWKSNLLNLVKVGTLVLVKYDSGPVLEWKLGRITNLYPGDDGVCRVVDIKVRNGEIRRSVNSICALPVE